MEGHPTMNPWLTLSGVVLVALISGVVTWLVARRNKSGSVQTSEAEVLWGQAQAMRNELRLEIVDCRSELEAMRKKNEVIEIDLNEAKVTIAELKGENEALHEHVEQLREDLQVALKAVAEKAETVSSDVHALKHEMELIQGGKI